MTVTPRSLFACLALCAAPAFAHTIEVISTDSARGGNVNFVLDGANYTGYSGAILARYDGGPQTETFFCIDLFTSIDYGTYGTTPLVPYTEDLTRVAWLYVNRLGTVTSANLGRAFQLAIWDIVHDGGDGPNAGRVRQRTGTNGTGTTVVNAWTNYLNVSLNQSSLNATIYRNYTLGTGVPAQDFVGPYQADALVPEPESWLMMSTCLAFLAWRRFRPKRGESAPPA
jgi:hypothetical protein